MIGLTNDEIKLIRERSLCLESVNMEIFQQGVENPRVIRGTGLIKQNHQGKFDMTLFALDEDAKSRFEKDIFASDPPGTVLPPDRFYILKIKDINDREWVSNKFLPDVNMNSTQKGLVLKGTISEIAVTESLRVPDDHPNAQIYSFDDVEIPRNLSTHITKVTGSRKSQAFSLNAWSFAVDDTNLFFIEDEGGLKVELQTRSGLLLQNCVNALERTMEYVFAYPIRSSIQYLRTNKSGLTRVRYPNVHYFRPRLLAPLDYRSELARTDVINLFSKYLQYLFSRKDPMYDPIAVETHKALLASSQTLDTEAVVLSIGVERILNSNYGDVCSTEAVENHIDSAMEYFASWEGPAIMKERIKGALNAMKAVRAKDILVELKEERIIKEEHFKSWDRLRNLSAHGALYDISIDELIVLCDYTYQLMNLLIFNAIGYKGTFTDYARPGYKSLEYPFS